MRHYYTIRNELGNLINQMTHQISVIEKYNQYPKAKEYNIRKLENIMRRYDYISRAMEITHYQEAPIQK